METQKKSKFGLWLIVVAVVVIFIGYLYFETGRAGELDGFAQCLKDSAAKFYGAFWCPVCKNQKELFGRSARLLPYVECSTTNGQGQRKECSDKNIEKYPIWDFKDGTRKEGLQSLADLEKLSGCKIPTDKPTN